MQEEDEYLAPPSYMGVPGSRGMSAQEPSCVTIHRNYLLTPCSAHGSSQGFWAELMSPIHLDNPSLALDSPTLHEAPYCWGTPDGLQNARSSAGSVHRPWQSLQGQKVETLLKVGHGGEGSSYSSHELPTRNRSHSHFAS